MFHVDFDGAVEAYRRALDAFVKGDAQPVAENFSRRDDVTLANPLGPSRLGWASVEKAIEAAAAKFEGGSVRFEETSRYSTPDLGYVVQVERTQVRLAGSEEMVVIAESDHDLPTRGRHLESRPPPRRPNHYRSSDQHDPRHVSVARAICARSTSTPAALVAVRPYRAT